MQCQSSELSELDYATFSALASIEREEKPADANIFRRLAGSGLISGEGLTDMGREALEPYRVRKAVVLAAGLGTRMAPVTDDLPKPLVSVNGKRIIDTLIETLISAGIDDIRIVRGYRKDLFDCLAIEYPQVSFIENDRYASANNISSVVAAADCLGNCYVCEGDLFVRNAKVVERYQYRSNYLGVPVAHTDDWCFKVEGDRICELLVGGDDVCHMYGISYWTQADGSRLANDVRAIFLSDGGKDRYWDEVALRDFKGKYDVYVRKCALDDVAEIDTLEELASLDSTYSPFLEAS